MMDDCVYCGSSHTFEEYPGVIRCQACGRIEIRDGNFTEEGYAHWTHGRQICVDHEFINTGTQRSWCKHCDIDATFIFERGEYVANDDIELFQGVAKNLTERDT